MISRLSPSLNFSDVSKIEQRLRTRGCMLILSPHSPRRLPVTESVVLPLLDQGASFAVRPTQPTASPEAQREQQVVACNLSSSLIPVRIFHTQT
jgi:hypothetical protein